MPSHTPTALRRVRLPRWLLDPDWPQVTDTHGVPRLALARVGLQQGRVATLGVETGAPLEDGAWDLGGALVLPGLVDAHVHLDKTFTLERAGVVAPGLLGAIEASVRDLPNWTEEDIRNRASRGLEWAWSAGTSVVRTHVNWPDIGPLPTAWTVLHDLAQSWLHRLKLEQVSLTKLDSFNDMAAAQHVAAQVKATGPHTVMGGFVHSTNWNPRALRNLLVAAQAAGLDVDLHADEELNPSAQGLRETARLLRALRFDGRVVCGHVCALAAMPRDEALSVLDEVAQAPITLVSLPITNQLLQDATPGHTPRLRGITLVKEARARGIPLLFASDNVEDPFCALGSYDPVDAVAAAAPLAQLDNPFDNWSDTICRADWLQQPAKGPAALLGSRADLVVFTQANATGWPSRGGPRVVLRTGVAQHAPPRSWLNPNPLHPAP